MMVFHDRGNWRNEWRHKDNNECARGQGRDAVKIDVDITVGKEVNVRSETNAKNKIEVGNEITVGIEVKMGRERKWGREGELEHDN